MKNQLLVERFQKLAGITPLYENNEGGRYDFVQPYTKTNTEKDNYFEVGEMYLDTEAMGDVIRSNSDADEQQLSQYLDDVANEVGADEGAYNNISLEDLLNDFAQHSSSMDEGGDEVDNNTSSTQTHFLHPNWIDLENKYQNKPNTFSNGWGFGDFEFDAPNARVYFKIDPDAMGNVGNDDKGLYYDLKTKDFVMDFYIKQNYWSTLPSEDKAVWGDVKSIIDKNIRLK